MIEFTGLEALIMGYAPMLVTILGIIISFLKMIQVIKQIKEDNKLSNDEKTQEILKLKETMSGMLNQNYELKSQINELLTSIDKIRRE